MIKKRTRPHPPTRVRELSTEVEEHNDSNEEDHNLPYVARCLYTCLTDSKESSV